ncbi:MAG: alpha/beta fold hydrolase [Alphaproteobacteria bacterium]|nr:alpha/beta fold hydrolase [Alphaproteobacteria bacterium]MBL0718213.1 alpha/beta fold hydrolase [Alphaproteobacteria bacterium]
MDIVILGATGQLHAIQTGITEDLENVAIILSGSPNREHSSMTSRVPYALAKSFQDIGFGTVRFDYRGVGLSEGSKTDDTNEMIQDISAVMNWAQEQCYNLKQVWIAGYDYGAYLTIKTIMRRPEISGIVLVSPDTTFDYQAENSPVNMKGILFQGAIEDPTRLSFGKELVQNLKRHALLDIPHKIINNADQNFSKSLASLYQEVKSFVSYQTRENSLFKETVSNKDKKNA